MKNFNTRTESNHCFVQVSDCWIKKYFLVEQIIETNKMNRKFIYYIIFAICFLLFSIVQDYIRPNYDGANGIIIYLLGVAPNFLPGIGLPALLYVVIPEVSKPNSSLFKNRLYWSVGISISGLIANEFITIFTPGRGVFDWNDILWTIIGAGLFTLIHRKLRFESWFVLKQKYQKKFVK